jgi:hypothetical protein
MIIPDVGMVQLLFELILLIDQVCLFKGDPTLL